MKSKFEKAAYKHSVQESKLRVLRLKMTLAWLEDTHGVSEKNAMVKVVAKEIVLYDLWVSGIHLQELYDDFRVWASEVNYGTRDAPGKTDELLAKLREVR